jgi:MoaA/NifB/PqqE/SkfB family radical SAM enzyme
VTPATAERAPVPAALPRSRGASPSGDGAPRPASGGVPARRLGRRDRRPSGPFWAFAGLVARLYLRRPALAEAVWIRYRSLRALLAGIGNEVAYRLGASRAPALVSVNLELTNRCNLRCTFCPTADGRMRRPRGFMDPALFRRALDGAGRLEFALLFQWGEPLLHPRFAELAAEAARRGARTLVTTNGTLLTPARLAGLLGSGVDRVTVSVDGDAATHERVRGVPLSETRDAVRRLVAARDAAGSPTAVDVSMVVAPETESGAASFLREFEGLADRVQTIPLLTRGERRTRCREPWRGGLVVLEDGRVTVCCVDHDGVLAVGDARETPLTEIWNGAPLRALRRAHARGELPPLCAGCTEHPTDAAAPRFSAGARPRRAPGGAAEAGA